MRCSRLSLVTSQYLSTVYTRNESSHRDVLTIGGSEHNWELGVSLRISAACLCHWSLRGGCPVPAAALQSARALRSDCGHPPWTEMGIRGRMDGSPLPSQLSLSLSVLIIDSFIHRSVPWSYEFDFYLKPQIHLPRIFSTLHNCTSKKVLVWMLICMLDIL